MKKFINHDTTSSLDACKKMWDMTGIVPVPKWDVACPCCRMTGTALMRQVNFHQRPDSPSKYRCKIWFKCTNCSFVYLFGVVIPKEMGEKNDNKTYTFNKLKRIYEER